LQRLGQLSCYIVLLIAFLSGGVVHAHAEAAGPVVDLGGGLLARQARVIPGASVVYIPLSSVAQPGGRAHTNYRIIIPEPPIGSGLTAREQASRAQQIETPASIACLYGLVPRQAGCAPDQVSKVAAGGSKAIAIVDAYHNATIRQDLRHFSVKFGLPPADLQIAAPLPAGESNHLLRPCLSDGPWRRRWMSSGHTQWPRAQRYFSWRRIPTERTT
jgi:hypothetical protein